ncbi:unnamed protein product [Anisakis simplex]|uniref:Ubiquitin carboxyl-terminal hydrolase n=1 Tax=Anisakis simplex TaxID=6269 RepID=A0A0M3JQV0_ANISI|nr:unnamed protein product [Anisakis simplex]
MEVSSRPVSDSEPFSPEVMNSLSYNVPLSTAKIFKDECMWCFNTPIHPGGLYICMKTFAGFCSKHVGKYCEKTGQKALLHIKRTKTELAETDGPQDKVTKLSGNLLDACKKVVTNESAQRIEQLETGVSGWDGEVKLITKHINLVQLENGVKVPQSGWKCEAEGCELTENLWLNLTDGAIKCGRSQYIQEGVLSKGNNHMRQHFDATGYPLVVKLGTITKDDADVFSYDEDESVRDPNLAKHLMHFGIDVQTAEKTEKSTLELELDLNQKWEWAMCQEDGANLQLAYGPGLTGMINIGSSCYMNSSIQMLLEVPDFCDVFGGNSANVFASTDAVSSHDDFNCQTAKVFSSLLSGDYSQEGSELNGIKPIQFKKVVGRGHHEFSTAKQQDAEEYIRIWGQDDETTKIYGTFLIVDDYSKLVCFSVEGFLYFLTKVDENIRKNGTNPVDAVRFKMESRFMDCASNQVRYEQKEDCILSLSVPLSCAQKEDKVDESGAPVRPTLTLDQCLASTFSEQTIQDFRSPVTGEMGCATTVNRMATFPDFLIIHLQKFQITDNWTVKKMDVSIKVNDVISLESFRAKGKQPNEISLPEDNANSLSANKSVPHLKADLVASLCSMGFSEAASRRAVYMTKNVGIEQASDWLMQHLDDPDINEEHPDLLKQKVQNKADASLISELTVLGCTPYQARCALAKHSNNLNAAAEWLFANLDKLPAEEPPSAGAEAVHNFRDGRASYELIGFISHMGTSPHSGHYVVHLKKHGKWYLFNDEKVALSQNPPSALAYIYLYKRL